MAFSDAGIDDRVPRGDFAACFDALRSNIERLLLGKRDVIELTMLCMIANGHLLLEDVPGVGKTLLAKTLASSIEGNWRRVQFTPDLLPSDVTGVSIFDRPSGQFRFRPGAVFANLVLCDEINRASPKAQSALLEAMEERQVTVDGVTHPLPNPWMVIATQNPYEHEGTYPLPESQLDRFLIKTSIGYPDRAAEIAVLDTHSDDAVFNDMQPVLSATDVRAMVRAAERIHVASSIKAYIVDVIAATRRHPLLRLGASPRAGLAILRVARARAAAAGRDFVVPDDVQALAAPVLSHRLLLNAEARAQRVDADAVVADVLGRVAVPGNRRG